MTEREMLPLADEQALSTREVAQQLGMAVRSVQLMVDRGELSAWRTPGGHRRIDRASVEAWLRRNRPGEAEKRDAPQQPRPAEGKLRALYIEDSRHFQTLVSLLVSQRFPQIDLHLADDGIGGLTMAGRLEPQLLLVDILLPGIDGATLITSLRSQPAFSQTQLIVLTSLDPAQLAPYAFALQGVPVVHKPDLVRDLPPLLEKALARP